MSNNQKHLDPLPRAINTNPTVLKSPFNARSSLSPGTTISQKFPAAPNHHRFSIIPKREIHQSCSLNPVKNRYVSSLNLRIDNQTINSINFNKKIDRNYNKSSSIKQAPSLTNSSEKNYQLNIHFLTNWGHPTLITCSEIDMLGKDKNSIQKISISEYIPRDPNNSMKPFQNSNSNPQFCNRLCNNFLIKEKIDESWYSIWDPESKTPLILTINITSSEPPEYIRIWNSKFMPESNLRNFTVFYERQVVGEGEVPMKFCLITKLNSEIIKPAIIVPPLCDPTVLEQIQEQRLGFQRKTSLINFGFLKDEMVSIFQENASNIDCDKYGKIFVPRVKQLKFTLIEAYDPNSVEMGLNSIELFDVDGKSISFSTIKTVNISNGKCVSSPFKLFKDHRRTMESSDMWICEKEIDEKIDSQKCSYLDSCTKLTVDLSIEKKIVLIRIWNYNGFDKFNHLGVKKMRIDSDKEFLWRGVLNGAKGMTTKIVDGITDIWLTDKTHWLDCPQISEYRTSRFHDSSRSSVEDSSRETTERSND